MSAGQVILNDDNFDAEIAKTEGGPLLVDFWATWCAPCRIVAPILDELSVTLKGTARIGKLDVDQNSATAAKFGIQGVPTLMLFKSGERVDQLVGAQSKEAITAMIQRHTGSTVASARPADA